MNKERLDALLESESITKEEYEELLKKIDDEGSEGGDPEDKGKGITGIDEDALEKIIKAKVDKITAKLGKDKADLQKKYDKLKQEKLTEDELRLAELSDKEKDIEDRERALLEKENRLYAIKAIKSAGLDDGSDKSLELVEFVLSDDTDEIDSKVKAFGELVKKFAQSEVDKIFKENGRTPGAGSKSTSGKNPYAKETFNLTEQMKLEVENPELAVKLKDAAGII